jgi:hypothetical protein
MAWVLSTVQSISLEEGAPELTGFFLGGVIARIDAGIQRHEDC